MAQQGDSEQAVEQNERQQDGEVLAEIHQHPE
jgi:hypothetical protein